MTMEDLKTVGDDASDEKAATAKKEENNNLKEIIVNNKISSLDDIALSASLNHIVQSIPNNVQLLHDDSKSNS